MTGLTLSVQESKAAPSWRKRVSLGMGLRYGLVSEAEAAPSWRKRVSLGMGLRCGLEDTLPADVVSPQVCGVSWTVQQEAWHVDEERLGSSLGKGGHHYSFRLGGAGSAQVDQ